jgi:hypothetical protein
MRATLAALTAVAMTFSVLTMTGGVSAASPANPAGRRNPTATTAFVPTGPCWSISRVRVLDSRLQGRVATGGVTHVNVGDVGGPDASVIGVSVNVTVLKPTRSGSASMFADGTRWSGSTMSFQAGHTVQNLETVPVRNGLIDIRNDSAGLLALVVDVVGYCEYEGAGDGWYVPMSPTRVFDTRSAQPVGPGQARTIPVSARLFGSPAGRGFPIINFTVLAPSRSGSLSVGTGNVGTHNTPSISFVAGQTEQSQLTIGMDSSGGLPIRNNSAAAIQVIADVVGYYANTGGGGSGDFLAANYYVRTFDSRAARTGPVPPGGTVTIPLHDFFHYFGIGRFGLIAASINVTVLTPRTDGAISVWPSGVGWDGAATISFTAGQTRQRMLLNPVGSDFDVQIRNDTNAPLTLIVDFNGGLGDMPPG